MEEDLRWKETFETKDGLRWKSDMQKSLTQGCGNFLYKFNKKNLFNRNKTYFIPVFWKKPFDVRLPLMKEELRSNNNKNPHLSLLLCNQRH